MIFASLLAKLGFDTSAWTGPANQAKSDIKQIDNSVKGATKSWKDQQRELKNTFKLMRGGAASMVVGKIAESINEITDKVYEWNKAQKEGIANYADLEDTAVRSVPIMGSVYSAARNILETVSGERAQRDKILESLDAQAKKEEASIKRLSDQRQGMMALRDTMKDMARQAELSGLHGDEKTSKSAEFTMQDQVKKAADEFKQATGRNVEDVQAQLNKLHSEGFSGPAALNEKLNDYQKIVDASKTIYENAQKDIRDKQESDQKALWDDITAYEVKQMQDAAQKDFDDRKKHTQEMLEQDKANVEENIRSAKAAMESMQRAASVSAIRGGNAGLVLQTQANDPAMTKQNQYLETQTVILGRIEDELKTNRDSTFDVQASF